MNANLGECIPAAELKERLLARWFRDSRPTIEEVIQIIDEMEDQAKQNKEN